MLQKYETKHNALFMFCRFVALMGKAIASLRAEFHGSILRFVDLFTAHRLGVLVVFWHPAVRLSPPAVQREGSRGCQATDGLGVG